MCGIAGSWNCAPPTDSQINLCLETLQHRGPDDKNYKLFKSKRGKNISLLFTRLAIIDLKKEASQPMEFEGLWLAFNGEIYNYKEIKIELQGLGAKFKTDSDTEVLLKGIKLLGWSILDKLEGMWAFALYDENLGQLSLCRDRFGEKPLSFIKKSDGIVFSSEVGAIKALSGLSLTPNLTQIKRFLVNGYKSLYKTTDTFFEEVKDVAPRTLVHFKDDGSITSHNYWSPNVEINQDLDFDNAVKIAKEKLTRSVELRLRADVPLAFSLSGGVDSVALASLARRELGVDVHGFTIRNTDPRYEEWDLVQQVIKDLEISHTGVELTTHSFLENLREMVVSRQTPMLTLSSFVQNLLMKKIASSGYKVVVGGVGADEIFSGYYDHHLFYITEAKQNERILAMSNWNERIKPFVQNPFLKDPELFIRQKNFREHIYLDSGEYASYLREEWNETFVEIKYHNSLLRNRMLNELLNETVPILMHEEDLNAMNASLENRSPYLDRDLVNFMGSVPTKWMVQNGMAKAVLRESVRGVAPNFIINNPRKIGFNVPIEDMLDLRLKSNRDVIFSDSILFDIIDRTKLREIIQNSNLSNSKSKFIFSFISTKLFLDTLI
jgi:asparagine synthase (glutamine-hydrolysing)